MSLGQSGLAGMLLGSGSQFGQAMNQQQLQQYNVYAARLGMSGTTTITSYPTLMRPSVIFGQGCIKSVKCLKDKIHCIHITTENAAPKKDAHTEYVCCHCGHTEQYQAISIPNNVGHGEHAPENWVFPTVETR